MGGEYIEVRFLQSFTVGCQKKNPYRRVIVFGQTNDRAWHGHLKLPTLTEGSCNAFACFIPSLTPNIGGVRRRMTAMAHLSGWCPSVEDYPVELKLDMWMPTMKPRVVLGPVVGQVCSTWARVLLELDMDGDIEICTWDCTTAER